MDPAAADTVREGDVLVAPMTTPDYVPAMKRAAAIITDRGGRTCHAAINSASPASSGRIPPPAR